MSLSIERKPFPYYRQIPYYIRKPLTMEGKPSLTIEGNPLLIRTTFKEIAYYRKIPFTNKEIILGNPLQNKEIPDYRRKSLPRDLQTNSRRKSLTIS